MRSVYFSEDELKCKCGCGLNNMQEETLLELDRLRAAMGKPLVITSGSRCAEWNAKQGGKPNSAHLVGKAADIAVSSGSFRWSLVEAAYTLGFKRIGVGNHFVHVDTDQHLPQRVMWTY